jgi:hypothetical protein
MVVLCGSGNGHRNKIGRKLGGKWGGGWCCCCQGPDVRAGWPDVRGSRAGCPGSGSVDELDELRVDRSNPGQNSEDFVDGNWGKGGGELDLPATHEIRGSNPTKLHHTNKSQKKLGGYFCGDFRNWGRTQQN